MGTWGSSTQYGATRWLNGKGLKAGFALLEHFTAAGDGAAGAHTSHQRIDAALGVVPKFFRRCGRVNGWVGAVGKLLQQVGIGQLISEFPRPRNRALHPF